MLSSRANTIFAFVSLTLASCAHSLETSWFDGQLEEHNLSAMNILSADEFSKQVVGKTFRYSELGSDLVTLNIGEMFHFDGRYSTGHRVIQTGSYAYLDGTVVIECACSFLSLSNERVFFRSEDRLFTSNADGSGPIVELQAVPSVEGGAE